MRVRLRMTRVYFAVPSAIMPETRNLQLRPAQSHSYRWELFRHVISFTGVSIAYLSSAFWYLTDFCAVSTTRIESLDTVHSVDHAEGLLIRRKHWPPDSAQLVNKTVIHWSIPWFSTGGNKLRDSALAHHTQKLIRRPPSLARLARLRHRCRGQSRSKTSPRIGVRRPALVKRQSCRGLVMCADGEKVRTCYMAHDLVLSVL